MTLYKCYHIFSLSFSTLTYNVNKPSIYETMNIGLYMPISNTLMFALTFKILISICWFWRSKECKLCLPIPGVVVLWCMFWHLLKPHLDILNYLLCRSLEIYMYIYDAKILFEQRWHFLIHDEYVRKNLFYIFTNKKWKGNPASPCTKRYPSMWMWNH